MTIRALGHLNTSPADRTPLNGKCKACNHVWPVAWLPMTIEKVAPLMKDARCPMCSCGEVLVA
jgi:hypothetical protein